MACKPGSVPFENGDGYSSSAVVASRIERPTRTSAQDRAHRI